MSFRTVFSGRTLASVRSGLSSSVTPIGNWSLLSFSLPDLPFDYGALEPAISGDIMQLHHQKHHQTYVTNYNKALEQLEGAANKGDAPALVKLQSAFMFNGGGHINHFIFWQNLARVREGGGEPPKCSLEWAIDEHFGSLEALVSKMNAEDAALQGSGWVYKNVRPDYLKDIWKSLTGNMSVKCMRKNALE